jgi:hypothetical protein
MKFPPVWSCWTFWQYGGMRIGDERVDGNVFNGDRAALDLWLRRQLFDWLTTLRPVPNPDPA